MSRDSGEPRASSPEYLPKSSSRRHDEVHDAVARLDAGTGTLGTCILGEIREVRETREAVTLKERKTENNSLFIKKTTEWP